MPPYKLHSSNASNAARQTTSSSLLWTRLRRPRLTPKSRNSYTLFLVPPPSSWTPPLHNFLCTVSPLPTLLPTSARNYPPSTLGWHLHNRPDGSNQTTSAPVKTRPQWSSPSPAQRHRTLQPFHASPPSHPLSALSAACALAPDPNATTATSLATTLSNAPPSPPADGAPKTTLLGTTPALLLPAPPAAAFVHTLRLYALTAAGHMKLTLPPAPNVRLARSVLVRRMVKWMGCRWSDPQRIAYP
jgi:hypothetical protein